METKLFSNVVKIESRVLSDEAMAFCPTCKAFQTVWFTDGMLNQTRKFIQYGNSIYHDCGSSEPCRLFLSV